MNYGKMWEQDFKKGMGRECIRLYDTTSGYAGVCNPCDFLQFIYPYQFLFELKSVKGNRLDFSNISANQWDSLDYFDKIFGYNPCVIVQYREEKVCYCVPFSVIKYYSDNGKKSINVHDCQTNDKIIMIPGKYKRTRFQLDATQFTKMLLNMAQHKGVDKGE